MRTFFLICSSYLVLTFSLAGQQPAFILQAYEDAHNAHDISTELSFLVEDVQFELKGVWSKEGAEEMRELAEWDARLNSQLDIHIQSIKGDSVFCSALEKNDWFKAMGMEVIEHTKVIFVIQNGLIHHIIAYPSPDIGVRINNFLSEISEWSKSRDDNTLSELITDGTFVYSEAAASKWMDLIQQWKKE